MIKKIYCLVLISCFILSACGGSGTSPSPENLNTNPDARNDSYIIDSDSELDVLINDTDSDGDTLSITQLTQPENAQVEILATNNIRLTIDQDFIGTDQFTYTISDGKGGSDTASVSLDLEPAEKRPVAVNDKAIGVENTVISIAVLANDSDANGDQLAITAVSTPVNGSAVIQNTQIIYTPNQDYSGEDTFTYTITDGLFEATATINVLVTKKENSANQPPIAQPDNTTVSFESAQIIDVLINDSDPENDVITLVNVMPADHGSVSIKTISRDGINVSAVEYIPDDNYIGPDSFIYIISDGIHSVACIVTIQVRITATNLPPIAKDDFVNVTPGSIVTIPVFANDSDPDGDQLKLVSVEDTSGGTNSIDDNGTVDNILDDVLTYMPAPGFTGTAVLVYTLSDGIVEDRAAVNFYVSANPQPREIITGQVHKGAVKNSLVTAHLFDRNGREQLNQVYAAATTETDGSWTTELPTVKDAYMLTAQGGRFTDESDPMVDAITQRVISLSNQAILQSMWKAGQSNVSINAYTSAYIRKARNESNNSFLTTIKNNRVIATKAMGFDPFASKTADPIKPQAGASLQELQYALYLGGFANLLNAHSIDQQLPLPTAELIVGSIQDLADCDINGLTFDGPINVLTPRGNRVFSDITDLNSEIRRFKNNNFQLFTINPPIYNIAECLVSGVSDDTTAPVVTLNPFANGQTSGIELNIGETFVDPGATAVDDIDGDISQQISVSISDGVNTFATLDTTVPGTYTFTYTAIDSSGNVGVNSDPRIVTVRSPVLSIADTSVLEGDVGTSDLVFTLSLDSATTFDVMVFVETVDNTATLADLDYQAKTETITIPAGQTGATFTVTVNADTDVEDSDFLIARMSNAINATLDGVAFKARGEIINDDSANLTVSNVSVVEGNSGTTNLVFQIILSDIVNQDVSVDFNTQDGTATVLDNDYIALAGSVTTVVIPAGTQTLTINIPVKGDTRAEADEFFFLNLSNAINASLTTTQVTGTIINDDVPVVSIDSPSISEGDLGTTQLDFTISLDQVSTQDSSVNVVLRDGTATTADNDYLASVATTVVFLAGEQIKNYSVSIVGDIVVEVDETLIVELQAPTNAVLHASANVGVGTIRNDDGVSVSVSDVSLTEGDGGTLDAVFTVTLSNPNNINIVTVDYQTVDSTAVFGADYLAQTGTLSFATGVTSATVTVPVIGDTEIEVDEVFTLELSNPTNATISDASGIATILDNDNPLLTVDSPSVFESDSGQANLAFTLSLDQTSIFDVTFDFSTQDGTALSANGDYIATAGSASIPAGSTSTVINIPVVGDTTVELDETLTLNLLNPVNAVLAKSSTIGTILNDDSPFLSISDSSLSEADAGNSNMIFNVTLDQISPLDISFDIATANGTATAGLDYTQLTQSFIIPAGNSGTSVNVQIADDAVVEQSETFTIILSNPTNAQLDPNASSAIGTVFDNDIPVLSISNASVIENALAPNNFLIYTVSLDQVAYQDVSFNYVTQDASATVANADYVPIAQSTAIIPAGSTSITISVEVIDDVLVEIDETVKLQISAATNANIDPLTNIGVGTIINDDGVTLSILDAAIIEGDAGTQNLVLSVKLSNPNNINTVTVEYTSIDGTATSGSDYVSTSGTLTFAPGVVNQTIMVPVTGDLTVENNETFTVKLSNPTNSAISTAVGNATITNDDVSEISIDSPTVIEGNAGTVDLVFTISLDQPSFTDVTVLATPTDGSATLANLDYTASVETLTLLAGTTKATYTVTVNGDIAVEADETLTVTLSAPTNATLGSVVGTGTITNDDIAVVSINSPSVVEGYSGTVDLIFTVSLDQPSVSDITVTATPADGSATLADSDYSASVQTVSILAGATAASYTVTVNGDAIAEPDEDLTVTLSAPNNADLGIAVGTGSILNDDPKYTMSVTAGIVFDEDGNGFHSVGDTITYTYTVTNIGTVPVQNVLIDGDSDLFIPTTVCEFASIAAGTIATCEAVYSIKQSDIDVASIVSNISTVTGTDSNVTNPNTFAPDSITNAADVPMVKDARLSVDEFPSNTAELLDDQIPIGVISANDMLRITLEAKNIGNTRLNNLVINNNLSLTPLSCDNGTVLEVGQSCKVTLDFIAGVGAVDGTLTSTTGATAEDIDFKTVNATNSEFTIGVSTVVLGDSDGDGVADVIEQLVNSDHLTVMNPVIYVDPSALVDGLGNTWADARNGIPTPGEIGNGISPAAQVFVLIKGGADIVSPTLIFDAPATAISCDNITIVGSLDNSVYPAKIETDDLSTGFDLTSGGNSFISGCNNFNFIGTEFFNATNNSSLTINNSSVGVYHSQFSNNASGSPGGAISSNGLSTLTIQESVFNDNVSILNGGAIYSGPTTNLNISKSRLINNRADFSNGGGIRLDNATAYIDSSTLSGNTAGLFGFGGNGGAVSVINNSALLLENSIISGNYVESSGGALDLNNNNVNAMSIFNNLFIGNAANRAGAISIRNTDPVDVNSNTFVFNQVNLGSAAAYRSNNDSAGNLFNNTFKDNYVVDTDTYLKNRFIEGNSLTVCSNNWLYVNDRAASCPMDVEAKIIGPYYQSGLTTAGYYVAKSSSTGTKNNGLGESFLYSLNNLYGEINKLDNSTVDIGFHNAEPIPFIPSVIDIDNNSLPANSGGYLRIIVTPLLSNQPIGPAQQVFVEDPATALAALALPSNAGEQLNRNWIPLIDLGNGDYELRLVTGAGPGSFNLKIIANGFEQSFPVTVN